MTLHVDVGHLLSNVAFGALFGSLVGRILGGGVAWLVIVSAGAIGNLINAMVQDSAHSSIGASTAVFAALGVLVSHALRPRSAVHQKAFRRWSPLIGGVLLFATMGVGDERTDVTAHMTGFLSGMLIGWAVCRLPSPVLASRVVQGLSGILAVALVLVAWTVGIWAVGFMVS